MDSADRVGGDRSCGCCVADRCRCLCQSVACACRMQDLGDQLVGYVVPASGVVVDGCGTGGFVMGGAVS